MLNEVFELKKMITKMNDMQEFLDDREYMKLERIKEDYDHKITLLSGDEKAELNNKFADWYARYIHLETIGSIKLPEG